MVKRMSPERRATYIERRSIERVEDKNRRNERKIKAVATGKAVR